MPRGELYINGKDAFTTWGVSLNKSGLSALIAPVPLKSAIENASAIENGKRVVRDKRPKDERTLSLGLNLSADTEAEFWSKYSSFCEELSGGRVDIETSFLSGTVYHCDYISCQSFSEYQRGIASFVLRLSEPNPAKRGYGDD